MKILCIVFFIQELIRKGTYRLLREPVIKASFRSCGKGVHIAEKSNIKGNKNICIGDDSVIGPGTVLWTTGAQLSIGKKVITGPNVTVITGDHRTNLVGRYMADVTGTEKEPCNDRDVVIEDDVWIGANATILKGVTIREGCVIAAGAVVVKNTEPYGIYAGIPAVRIKDRFSVDELAEHQKRLQLL